MTTSSDSFGYTACYVDEDSREAQDYINRLNAVGGLDVSLMAFAKLHGRALQPSECVYSKSKHADWVCYVLKKPVLFEHTLAYQPDNRPRVMDTARVSFTAIQTSEEVFDEYFDSPSRFLLEKVRRGEADEF